MFGGAEGSKSEQKILTFPGPQPRLIEGNALSVWNPEAKSFPFRESMDLSLLHRKDLLSMSPPEGRVQPRRCPEAVSCAGASEAEVCKWAETKASSLLSRVCILLSWGMEKLGRVSVQKGRQRLSGPPIHLTPWALLNHTVLGASKSGS